MEYCFGCLDCENCFGCVGLYRQKFCILNKSYKEEEYWPLLDALKCAMLETGEYGRPLPRDMNLAGAQFSAGALLIGYSKEEIASWGGELFDERRGMMYVPETNEHQRAVQCMDEELGRPFLVTLSERTFYEAHKLPVPQKHFLTRLKDLVRLSNSPLTEPASCASCGKTLSVHKNLTFSRRRFFCQPCYLRYLEQQ